MSKLADHDCQASEEYDPDSLDDSAPVMVVIVDRHQCWIGEGIDYDVGLTLLTTMSEDPACWQDVPKYWPRYRTDLVCDELPVQQWTRCDEAAAWEAIDGHGNWLLFDLQDKRVVTGKENQEFDCDMTLVLETDAQVIGTQGIGKQGIGTQRRPHNLLPLHLPPWWELCQKVNGTDVSHRREVGFTIPRTDRELLYGARLIEDLTSRIMDIALAGRMPDHTARLRKNDGDGDDCSTNQAIDRAAMQAWYELTAEVHREWLMTERDDLAGGRPRDLLHGAHEWSDAVIEGQRRRFDRGAPMVAAPEDVDGYAHTPMGSEEMIVYFDLCREVIQAGWCWVASRSELKRANLEELAAFLQKVRDEWLEMPFEGGAPPRFIIECSRRRVPRASGVAIEGMDECESADDHGDCDCPICNMLASGKFGTCFTSLDGHHLELDDEFAFSMFERFEDWEEQSSEWREISEGDEDWEPPAKSTVDRAGTSSHDSLQLDELPVDEQPVDEFGSAWSGPMSDGPLPGDRHGFMKLAFRLVEIIADLETFSAPHKYIASLNRTFRCYFESDSTTISSTRTAFKETLEEVAGHYPGLLPKVCDLASQVDELERRVSRC